MSARRQRNKKAARAGRNGHRQPARGQAGPRPRGWAKLPSAWRRLSLRTRWLAAIGALIVAAGVTAGLVAALTGAPTVGERPYLSFTGCLLTDADGINGQPAAAAWAGLQDAAAATRMQAQYLAVPASAGGGADGAAPYLASLVTQHCSLVVAAGSAQAAAVASDARRFGTVRFVVVGGAASGANVTVVRGGDAAVRADVDSLARAALADAG